MKRSFFILFPPFVLFSPLLRFTQDLNPYAHLGALTLYNRIGFDRSRGPRSLKSRTRIAPNGLRFIVRANERLTAFLELESVIAARNAWRLFVSRVTVV